MHYESLMFSKSQFEYYRVFEELSKLPKRPYPLRNLASLTDKLLIKTQIHSGTDCRSHRENRPSTS